MKEISIQVHDYDNVGRYLIVEDRKTTRKEVAELKARARASVHADWDKLPEQARHIVYYAELLDKDGDVWYASIYMHGEAFDETEFGRVFNRPDIGYVGAVHKKDLPPELKQ